LPLSPCGKVPEADDTLAFPQVVERRCHIIHNYAYCRAAPSPSGQSLP
jgi:hypothetical protein